MDITNDLITQWEPKIHKFLQNTFVLGMEREDIAQELRIAVVKAASNFDELKGVIFHTYLHTVMVNTIRTLISKAQKTKDLSYAYSIDGGGKPDESLQEPFISNEINKSLIDPVANELMVEFELNDLLVQAQLVPQEFEFLDLRTEGLTMEQISDELGESAYKIRAAIQKKVRDAAQGDEFFYEEKIPAKVG